VPATACTFNNISGDTGYGARNFDSLTVNAENKLVGRLRRPCAGRPLSLLLQYAGAGHPGGPNRSGKDYDAETNVNTIPHGREIDSPGRGGFHTGPDGGISAFDFSDLLTQVGDSCIAPPWAPGAIKSLPRGSRRDCPAIHLIEPFDGVLQAIGDDARQATLLVEVGRRQGRAEIAQKAHHSAHSYYHQVALKGEVDPVRLD
jgi:hypothetical protein